MASLVWGNPVKTTPMKRFNSESELKASNHEVGKIYTEVYKYSRISLMSQTLSLADFNKFVAETIKQFQGKAKLLYAVVNSTNKTIAIQYTPIVSFIAPLVIYGIVLLIAFLLGVILSFGGAEVGTLLSTGITEPIVKGATDIITNPWVLGTLLVAGLGYVVLQNPAKVGEVRREFYARS